MLAAAYGSEAQTPLNGGFEEGVGINAEFWAENIANPGEGANTLLERVNTAPFAGSFHMLLQVDGGSTRPGNLLLQSDQFAIEPETEYVFSFFARRDGAAGPGLFAAYEIQFLDSDGSNGGGVKGTVGPTNFYNTLGETYQEIRLSIMTPFASTGADAAFIRFQFAGGAFAESDGRLLIDEVYFLSIPEPTSTSLLALVGIGVLTRRTRRCGAVLETGR
jgi:hypothetical protein